MTTRLLKLTGLVLLAAVVSVTSAAAQEWRGMGRAGGKVLDDQTGQPVEGVTVKAVMPRSANRGPGDGKTNSKGEWAVGGLASGEWALDFSKDGYETRSISVPISDGGNRGRMEIRMKKTAPPPPDANAAIKAKLVEAAAKMEAKEYAAARTIYEDLSAKHPEVKQFRPLIARTYYGEGNKAAAIEQLRKAHADDPENLEVKMVLGTTLMEDGKNDEARQVLASVDEARITDPAVLLNIGIGLINDKKQADAIAWFDKAIARFPQHPDGYYYRGISYLSLGKSTEAKADLQKYVMIAPPTAPELATAKQILETIK